ncbi:MAG: IPT/TIG domain-containing protein [Blastocatellia bacterium]
MLRGRSLLFPLACLFLLFSSVSNQVPIQTASAQTSCTPPLYQGYPSACANIHLRWLNRDPVSQIDHYEIFRGGVKVGQAPGNAISWSEAVGCGFGARYIIKQVMKSGASCSVETTGNAPHTKPCDLCTGGQPPLNLVSSASFTAPVAPGSIATVFAGEGQSLTSATAAATGFPLPTNISGTEVQVNGEATSLFYVSPAQINFLMPKTNAGAVNVVVTGSGGQRTEGAALTGPNPAVYVSNRVVAALVTADGRNYGRTVDGSGNAVPISVGNGGQPNYLILFGTGIRDQGAVQVKVGGTVCSVVWSGAHPQFAGLDQINVQLPESLRGVGLTGVTVTAGGFVANLAQITIGN